MFYSALPPIGTTPSTSPPFPLRSWLFRCPGDCSVLPAKHLRDITDAILYSFRPTATATEFCGSSPVNSLPLTRFLSICSIRRIRPPMSATRCRRSVILPLQLSPTARSMSEPEIVSKHTDSSMVFGRPRRIHLRRVLINVALFLLLASPLARTQDRSGELRLTVTDSDGAVLSAHGLLISQASHFELTFDTAATGEYIARKLPLGTYHLTLEHAGFAPYNSLIEVRSELP